MRVHSFCIPPLTQEAELKKQEAAAAAAKAAAKAAAMASSAPATKAKKAPAPVASAAAPKKAKPAAAAAAPATSAAGKKGGAAAPAAPAATAAAKGAKKAKAAAASPVEESPEWAEMRRLEREANEVRGLCFVHGLCCVSWPSTRALRPPTTSNQPNERSIHIHTHASNQLLNLSPLMAGAGRGSTPPPAPEAEFVKRGRKAAATAAEAAAAAAAVAPVGRPGTKAASKAEAEAERKELLKGLDAVMEDLQRRADDKRRKAAEDKEAKGKAARPGAGAETTKALGGSKGGAGGDAELAMKAASKLTIPMLKAYIEKANAGALPSGRAKKDEYVRAAAELLVEKAKASGSMAEALKALPGK